MQRLLRLLVSGKPQTLSSLADSLNLTEGVIRLMAAQLVQLGYLQESGACDLPPSAGDAPACQGCAGCLLTGPQHFWALTDKGLRAAKG